jgi:hypothetical protein
MLERDADQTITHPALGSRGTPLDSTVGFQRRDDLLFGQPGTVISLDQQ